jgi:small nuclear ribonucleoprotein F
MTSFVPLNPRPFLQDLINKNIEVRLKWGDTAYRGRLVSIDSYMNIQLANTEEVIDSKVTGSLGQVLLR